LKKFQYTSNFAKSRWDALSINMGDLLDNCRKFADITMPFILPPDDQTQGYSATKQPLNNITARGITNICSKLLVALLPPNSAFFKLNVDEQTLLNMGANPDEIDTMMADINLNLSQIESEATRIIESSTLRKRFFDALVLLVVTGNALLHVDVKNNASRTFSLLNYRVNRDHTGVVREIILSEQVEYRSLDDAIQKQITDEAPSNSGDDKFIELLTYIYLEDGNYHQFQEINGVKINGTDGKYPINKSPWLAIRFSQRNNSDYGVGLIEQYYGSISELENYHIASRDFITTVSDVKFGIKTGSSLTPRKLAALKSGEVIGNCDMNDVTELKITRQSELQIIEKMMGTLKAELAQIFLLTSGNIRNAERVTAEEIRMIAQELESSLGGTYSLLSIELQSPIVSIILSQTPSFAQLSDEVSFQITTGLAALGRSHELAKLDEFISRVAQSNPESINWEEYGKRVATSLGIDPSNLLKSQQQLQQEQMQQQGAQMMSNIGASPDTQRQAQQMVDASGGDINKMMADAGVTPEMLQQFSQQ